MPYTCRVITRFDEQDMTRLLAMVDAAWRLDYQEDFRLDFSAGFMDRCTGQPGWFGVLMLDDSGAPIGWEIAMPRVLRTGAREFNAFYVTMFSVAPDHRRRVHPALHARTHARTHTRKHPNQALTRDLKKRLPWV